MIVGIMLSDDEWLGDFVFSTVPSVGDSLTLHREGAPLGLTVERVHHYAAMIGQEPKPPIITARLQDM
jgi:hypothetical protein